MQYLHREEYDDWRKGAVVLERDGHGEKVLCLADGTFLKLFRRKSWLSKTAFYPPAKRFSVNAAELERLHIPCPKVIKLYWMASPYRSVVHYDPLPGSTLRDLLKNDLSADQQSLFARFSEFIVKLHDLGIYFRSLHMGNVVITPDNQFGLIDISDMRCLRRPLSSRMRARNYQHLLRYAEDWANIEPNVKALFSIATTKSS